VTVSTDEVKKLILRAQRGDESAISELYLAYAEKIFRFIVYRAPEEEAEDLTAEVFVSMVERISTYRITEAPFEAWLYRIAAARVSDYFRHRTNHHEIELLDSVSEFDSLPEEVLVEEQEIAELRTAIQQLSEQHQNVLVLRFIDHKSHEEVAQILNKSVSAVKSIQHRALTQLANLLGSEKQVRHYLRGYND
jgi:RNA polymerase sigma-70 factor (ECF subfamily)